MLRCLNRVYGAIGRGKKIDKSLGCYTLEAQKSGTVRIFGTDLEVSILTRTPAKVEEVGTKLVNARFLHDAVKSLPQDQMVSFAMAGSMLELKCGKISFKFPTFDVGEDNVSRSIEGIKTSQIGRDVLRTMIDQTLYASCSDDTRPNLHGICFEPTGTGGLRLIATDAHRLAVVEGPTGGVPTAFEPFTVPQKGCGEIRKLLTDDEKIEMGFDDRRIVIRSGEKTIMTCQLVEGKFPDWNQVIPKTTNKFATVNRKAIIVALGRLKMFLDKREKGTSVELNGSDSMTFRSQNTNLGEGQEEVPCTYEGEKLTIGFSGAYLLEACSSFSGENLKLSFLDAVSPGVITDPKKENMRAIVMPMRI